MRSLIQSLSIIKQIYDILGKQKYSGELNIRVLFNEGGIQGTKLHKLKEV